MFRSLAQLVEGYTNASVWSTFKQTQTPLATTTLVPSTSQQPDDINYVAKGLTPSSDIDIQSSINKYAGSLKQLNQMNEVCLSASTISDVINLNESGSIQCGWYYNKGTGSSSQLNKGYLSTKQGPVIGLSPPPPQQPYTFYFGNNSGTNRFFNSSSSRSLQAGEQYIETERCNLPTCQAVTGKTGCAYCKTSLRGIPVDQNGKPKYASLTCAGVGSLATSASMCPPPATVGPAATGQTNSETVNTTANTSTSLIRPVPIPPVSACSPDTNSRFSGACLQSVLRDNGCSTQGSLSLALNGFTSTTNVNSVQNNNPNIKTFMEENPAFNLTNFLTASNQDDAKTQAKALANASQTALDNAWKNPSRQTKQNTLAVDLCTQRGYFLDNYNFCVELGPNTPIPTKGWDLGCLQQAWKDAGLRPQGTNYPSIYNIKTFNKLSPWSKVTDYMAKIYEQIFNGGPLIESFESNTREYTSRPFMLQSKNLPDHYLTYMGSGLQLGIQPKNSNSSNQLFVWRKGDINGSIRIFPVANSDTILRHKNFTLISFPKKQEDTYLKESITFYVRPGNANSNMISLQATYVANVNDPSPFYLRHTNYKIVLGNKNDTYNRQYSTLFNEDSTFQALDSNLDLLEPSFFVKSIATENTTNPDYPGQRQAIDIGWGIRLDAPLIPPTDSGMEIYECIYRNRGILVITKYSIATSLPPVTGGRIHALYTLSNYSVDTTTTVTPTLKLGAWDAGAIAVNSYLTGWGWQSREPIDAPPNTFESINHIKSYNLNTKNGRYPGQPNGYNQPYGAFELKGGDIPNIVKTQWWWGGGGRFDYTLNPPAKPYIVRDPYAPFMRFEPVTNGFTEVRFGDMGNNPYSENIQIGAVSYHTEGVDKLANPGSNGYVTLRDHIFINYVDAPVWNIATLVFSVDFTSSIPGPQSIMYVGNVIQPDPSRFWETRETNGFGLMALPNSSSTSSYNLAVQSLTANMNVKQTSITITLTKNMWYMAMINKLNGEVEIFALTKSNTTYTSQSKGVIIIPEYTLSAFTNQNTLPRIRLGAAPLSISLKVAFLHLFDNTISSVDPDVELKGYAKGGYETGVF